MKGKVLAIDFGTKHIGLATGDLEIGIAFPRGVIKNTPLSFDEILVICQELGVRKLIVGLPLGMKDSQRENPIMRELRGFMRKLKLKLKNKDIDIEYVDERLSSFEAASMTGKSGKSFKENLDAHAAQIILQRYFNGL